MNNLRNIRWDIFLPAAVASLVLLFFIIEFRGAAIRIALPFVLIAVVGYVLYAVLTALKNNSNKGDEE